MTGAHRTLPGRVDELRARFDASFAVAASHAAPTVLDLLAIRIGDAAYAVRLGDVSGLASDAFIQPVPSHCPDLVGITAVRSEFVPVFDLRMLLGHALGAIPRWTIFVGSPTRLGLAFDHFDGHIKVADHVAETVATAAGALPIIDLPSVTTAIEQRATTTTTKEP